MLANVSFVSHYLSPSHTSFSIRVGKKIIFLNQKIGFIYLNQTLENVHESCSKKLQITFFLHNAACNDIAHCIMMTNYCLPIFCYCTEKQ